MNKQPCYFFVDHTGAATMAKAKVQPLCLKCGKGVTDAMYWAGGYGPWEVKCLKCEAVIWAGGKGEDRHGPADAR